MITITRRSECKHANGWYVRVRFGIFSKLIFVCSDCGDWQDAKEKK